MPFRSRDNRIAKRNIQNNSTAQKDLASQITDFLKALVGLITWQLLIIIILILFYSPIRRMIDVLPSKFEKSNEISVWNLSFKIQEQATASGNTELAGIIQGLSQKALERLLSLGNTSFGLVGNNFGDADEEAVYYISDLEVYKELAAKELVTSNEDLFEFEKWVNSLKPIDRKITKSSITKEQQKRLTQNSVRITDKGKRAYEIIIKVVADSIGNKQ